MKPFLGRRALSVSRPSRDHIHRGINLAICHAHFERIEPWPMIWEIQGFGEVDLNGGALLVEDQPQILE